MKKSIFLASILALGAGKACAQNIIIINGDDIGYGDLSCNGTSAVATPNVDRVASQGVRFTNVHATSATSTPSRYSLLTGTYAWRSAGRGVAPGDAAMLIKPSDYTIPKMLQRAGYTTAAVGKWHLGLGAKTGAQNWNEKITPALQDIGFDYSYIMAATADRVPCVYIEQGRVVGLDPADPIQVSYTTPFDGEPTGNANPELLTTRSSHGHDQALINGIGRIGYMKGGKSALWVDENIADSITAHAVGFICDQAKAEKPFFLYFATNDIHVPRVPHPRFAGKSGLGVRGDAILEFDYSVGAVLDALDSLGIAGNTLIIITSDNGPVIDDGYVDSSKELLGTHRPSGAMRGGKYSIFEAGTAVPFILRLDGRAHKGVVSDALISQVDLFASLAELTSTELQQGEASDSRALMRALLGGDKVGRDWLVQDAGTRSIIDGRWKYIAPSGGVPYDSYTDIELGNSPQAQLYDMVSDRAEKNNLASKYPKIVGRLASKLAQIESGGQIQ